MTDKGKPSCFVISPIGGPGSKERLHADMVLGSIIRPALEADYAVERADAPAGPSMINEHIIERILNADLAIADLTFHNPNVFYELGLRHMKEKPVILIQQAGTGRAFDISGVNTIDYDISDFQNHVATREKLKAAAAEELAKPHVSNPVTAAMGSIQLRNTADSRDELILALTGQMSELQKRFDNLEISAIQHPGLLAPWNAMMEDRFDRFGTEYMRSQALRRELNMEDKSGKSISENVFAPPKKQ